ncbi:unnamed protein product [Periconia digitata]|uniref:Uncharacterized protein n=1 Tax=Periconia digitata TaxID=1303443 RepID=A0A9W4UE51_9PLEO|nr:unnamed protein product [Periconia digitata]
MHTNVSYYFFSCYCCAHLSSWLRGCASNSLENSVGDCHGYASRGRKFEASQIRLLRQ